MMARVRTPPDGMPAAPTLDAVAVTLGEEKGGQRKISVGGEAATGALPPSGLCPFSGGGVKWVRGPSCSHPHSQDGDDLHKVQGLLVELCDEHCGHTLEERRPIHVDGGTDG